MSYEFHCSEKNKAPRSLDRDALFSGAKDECFTQLITYDCFS